MSRIANFCTLIVVILLQCAWCSASCVSGTVYARPNCNEYYSCISGTFVPYTCPSGLHFSSTTLKCTSVLAANCFCNNLDDGKYRLKGCYPNSTEQYVTCQSGNVASVKSCSSYFIFDASEPTASFCTSEATTCQNITTGFCAELDAGDYRVPGTCSSYVTCTAGIDDGVMTTCASGNVYSETLGNCVSDLSYPINCGGTYGLYISIDGSNTDIRYNALAIQPFSVLTGLKEIISGYDGKSSGSSPSLVDDKNSLPQSAYSFSSNYLLPTQSSINFVGNYPWTLIVDLQLQSSSFFSGSSFEMLNFQSVSTPVTKYVTLMAVYSSGAYHFEMQCPCSSSSAGSVSVQTNFSTPTSWHSLKVIYSSTFLNISIDDAQHVYQSPFSCFLSCGVTTTGKTANVQITQGTNAACLIFLSNSNSPGSTSYYQSLVCPSITQSDCYLEGSNQFDITQLTTGDTAIMTCSNDTAVSATVGCSSVPVSADCRWTDFNVYECTNQQFSTTWDEDSLCFQDVTAPRAIFPFNYITQLRDVAYGLEANLVDAIVTKTIDQSNKLALYDGRLVVEPSLALSFLSTFYIYFNMLASKGCQIDWIDGATSLFRVAIFYDTTTNSSVVQAGMERNSITLANCSLPALFDIRNGAFAVEIYVDDFQTLHVSLNGSDVCSSTMQQIPFYGNFTVRAIQSSQSDFCSVSCLILMNKQTDANPNTLAKTYCSTTDLSLYYTTQMLSVWPFNVVSATTDMFGLNDITSPSSVTYSVFLNVPTGMATFAAINMSAVAPYQMMSLSDSRSTIADTSDNFAVNFWLYPSTPSQILTIYAADGKTSTFSLSITGTGSVTIGILFNSGLSTVPFSSSHSFLNWHYYVFSMQRRTSLVYSASLIVLNGNLTAESIETQSIILPSTSPYSSIAYTRGSSTSISGSGDFISCLSYLDRPILTVADAASFAQSCPTTSSPCNTHSTQVASGYYLPDPNIFNTQMESMTALCSNASVFNVSVESFCIVDRNANPPRTSCQYNVLTNTFQCSATRTLFSPPCGATVTSASLQQEWLSTVYCAILSPPANGSVAFSDPKCPGGSLATFSCYNGSYVSGQSTVACLATGSWNGSVPRCKYVDCGDPTATLLTPRNATTVLSPPHPTYYNAKHDIACLPGYVFDYATSSTPNITCQSSGTWSDPEMACERGSCGVPSHGFYNIIVGSSYLYNDTVMIKCISGYQFETGELNITKQCNTSLIWTPGDALPDCIELECPAPTLSSYSTFTPVMPHYYLGSVINVSCVNESYQLMGERIRTCQPNQQWSGAAPFCQIRSCSDPGEAVGATRSYSSLNVNDTVSYTCNQGFQRTAGYSAITCQQNGLWDGVKPTCSKIDCGAPGNGTNATVSYSTTLYNDTALYSCYDGFNVTDGDLVRQCQSDRTWSGDPPSCSEIVCKPMTLPNGTSVNGTIKSLYMYGESIPLTCQSGYRWADGSLSRSCTADASWSGESLLCEPKTCDPPTPRARMATYKPSALVYNFLDVVKYSCLDGYIFTNGSLNRTCLDDGSWSGSPPVCSTPPGQAPATQVAAVQLNPTEAKNAALIGIPVGAVFLGTLLGFLILLDIISSPKYYQFAKRRYRKAGLTK